MSSHDLLTNTLITFIMRGDAGSQRETDGSAERTEGRGCLSRGA